jgi:hypothetical protein
MVYTGNPLGFFHCITAEKIAGSATVAQGSI